MSADNWAICPRCKSRRQAKATDATAKAQAAYGVLPIAEFDALRAEAAKLTIAAAADTDANRTLREDYEFYGAEDGEVTANYRCSCTVCGLSSKFEHVHPLFPGSHAGR